MTSPAASDHMRILHAATLLSPDGASHSLRPRGAYLLAGVLTKS
jgi:hypothetical protein